MKRTRKSAKEKLNAPLVRQWLRGQRAMNKIAQSERRVWLQQMTAEEARQIFDDLNQLGDRWKESGGDLEALERRRIESKIEGRRIFMRIARKSNGRRN